MVKSVLEPISNKQRLQILKSMASETMTFTALSELTGLRGGNLLFHIQKLLESDLILQRHERGDYMITEKGYNLLIMLSNFKKYLKK
jgi:predicted transcriptional regulator